MSKSVAKQLRLNFGTKNDYLAGSRAGFKDKPLKRSASAEYRRGYIDGRNRRDKCL